MADVVATEEREKLRGFWGEWEVKGRTGWWKILKDACISWAVLLEESLLDLRQEDDL